MMRPGKDRTRTNTNYLCTLAEEIKRQANRDAVTVHFLSTGACPRDPSQTSQWSAIKASWWMRCRKGIQERRQQEIEGQSIVVTWSQKAEKGNQRVCSIWQTEHRKQAPKVPRQTVKASSKPVDDARDDGLKAMQGNTAHEPYGKKPYGQQPEIFFFAKIDFGVKSQIFLADAEDTFQELSMPHLDGIFNQWSTSLPHNAIPGAGEE